MHHTKSSNQRKFIFNRSPSNKSNNKQREMLSQCALQLEQRAYFEEKGPPSQKDFHFTKPENAECVINANGCQKYTSEVGRTKSSKLQTATLMDKSQLTPSQPTHWLQQELEERLPGMKISFVLLVKTNTHLCGLLLPLTPVGTNVWSIPWGTPSMCSSGGPDQTGSTATIISLALLLEAIFFFVCSC